MASFLVLILLAVTIAWLVGLIKPSVYSGVFWEKASRKSVSFLFGGLFILLFIAIGIIGNMQSNNPVSSSSKTSANLSNKSQSPTSTPIEKPSISPTATTEPSPSVIVASQSPSPNPHTETQSSSCNPNYSPCVPNSSTDLNCSDIGFEVKVIGTDVYHLDRDKNGYGCESYN
jgi:hypothetical protein